MRLLNPTPGWRALVWQLPSRGHARSEWFSFACQLVSMFRSLQHIYPIIRFPLEFNAQPAVCFRSFPPQCSASQCFLVPVLFTKVSVPSFLSAILIGSRPLGPGKPSIFRNPAVICIYSCDFPAAPLPQVHVVVTFFKKSVSLTLSIECLLTTSAVPCPAISLFGCAAVSLGYPSRKHAYEEEYIKSTGFL